MKKILEGQSVTMKTISGKIVIKDEDVEKAKEPVILFRHHTIPDDFEILMKVVGVVTTVGGTLSHASIIAREFDKGGIISCDDLEVDIENNQIKINNDIYPAGTQVTIDGASGSVFLK